MSDKGTPVEPAFRLGFCAWAKAQAAYPRQREHTVLAASLNPNRLQSTRSGSVPGCGEVVGLPLGFLTVCIAIRAAARAPVE